VKKLISAIVAAWVIIIGVGLFFGYPKYQDIRQRKMLFERSDYPQIATACVKLALSVTNESTGWQSSDPAIPPILRSLSPREIIGYSNCVIMEFGGMGRYSYTVLRSESDPRQWTLDINSPEQYINQRLTTITNN
jgi:hypothetical protein